VERFPFPELISQRGNVIVVEFDLKTLELDRYFHSFVPSPAPFLATLISSKSHTVLLQLIASPHPPGQFLWPIRTIQGRAGYPLGPFLWIEVEVDAERMSGYGYLT
jgi:hypothetical protein